MVQVGGDGRDANHMNGVFNFTYLLDNGWTVGTQPTLSVDWEARGGERGTFGLGPQVGKMCKCGGLPTLLQLQVQYLPRFVQTWRVRSGIFSCRRLRRSRPSSRERSSDCGQSLLHRSWFEQRRRRQDNRSGRGAHRGGRCARADALSRSRRPPAARRLLDEVTEMSLAAQAKFLRVLREREFQRLGATAS